MKSDQPSDPSLRSDGGVPPTRKERELCRVCGGNGVLKITGGVSVCYRCHGDCWDPAGSSSLLGRTQTQEQTDEKAFGLPVSHSATAENQPPERDEPATSSAPATEDRWEEAKLRAYRQARVFEPNMDMYHAAMAVYAAAFGKPDGEPAVLMPDGSTKQPWELGNYSGFMTKDK